MRFDSYHPMINVLYFAFVIYGTIAFLHPIFLAISFGCAFAYSVKLNGGKALIFNLCLIPLIALWTMWYAFYHHFGVTRLALNFIGNEITLESIVFGAVIGIAGAGVIMWISCIHAVFSTDKVTYLLGRISPKLSLFLAVVLRMVPRMRNQLLRLELAQAGIGRGRGQGNIFGRFKRIFQRTGVMITWTAESLLAVSDSMRCRGYTLKGRTAFSIYRFDNRDRSFVIALFACVAVLIAGVLCQQTRIHYDPRIIMNRITPLSIVFYIAYALLCLMPMGLQMIGELRRVWLTRRCVYPEYMGHE